MSERSELTAAFDAMLLTRAWPNRAAVDDFDAWQHRRHFPELVAVPGVGRAEYYRTIETDLPQVLQGSGNRIAVYWSDTIEDLLTFLTHPGLAMAVADGSRFFPSFNELDGDIYTGNIYRLDDGLDGTACAATDGADRVWLVERYEVLPAELEEFERWLETAHVDRLLAARRIVSLRVGRAVREDLPIPYYNSRGSHVVLTDLDGDPATVGRDEELLDALADAQRWDRRLGYVRREIAQLAFGKDAGTADG